MLEQALEFLKSLTTIQWAMIGIGLYLLWPTIKKYISMINIEVNKPIVNPVTPITPVNPVIVPVNVENVDFVCEWSNLYNKCASAGMVKACEGLEKILPDFIKKA